MTIDVALEKSTEHREFPVLPLRDVVIYPHMVIPLFVGRSKSIKALEAAMVGNKEIFLVTQRNAHEDDPEPQRFLSNGNDFIRITIIKITGWNG